MGNEALPILFIARYGILRLFRKERFALGGDPGRDGYVGNGVAFRSWMLGGLQMDCHAAEEGGSQ